MPSESSERTASHRSAFAYHPGFLGYDFGPSHPLRPERITVALDLLQATGILDVDSEILSPPEATKEELTLVHDADYVDAVAAANGHMLGHRSLSQFGFSSADNPVFPEMHRASALVTGGSVATIREIMSGRLDHAFNAAGGLHHAQRARASGFCVYNDPAVAAAIAVREFDARVLYLDFDCHHGDGVQWLFYDSPHVMTVSFHESGRYLFPGTGGIDEAGEGAGRGYSLNVPFEPFTQDASWQYALASIVPEVVRRYRPDVIISSHGCDTHRWDPLTHLALTTASFFQQARLVHDLAHEFSAGRWLAVGSGGYDWMRVVPRSWSIVWAEMTNRPLPDQLPDSWLNRWSLLAMDPLPQTYRDGAEVGSPIARADEIEQLNRRTITAAEERADVIG